MPMVNLTAPKGALTPGQKEELTEQLTHVLLKLEGGARHRQSGGYGLRLAIAERAIRPIPNRNSNG